MKNHWSSLIVGIVGVCYFGLASADEKKSEADAKPNSPAATASESQTEEAAEVVPRVSLDAARERAELMHTLYSSTLETMHHRYFHGDRAVVPARALEDVFTDIERKTHTQARWISASLKPMSIDHKPKTKFEKKAASEITKGASMVEKIEDGYYRRAGSISLSGGCTSCHSGFFNASTSREFAGLIISIPVEQGAKIVETESVTTPQPD